MIAFAPAEARSTQKYYTQDKINTTKTTGPGQAIKLKLGLLCSIKRQQVSWHAI